MLSQVKPDFTYYQPQDFKTVQIKISKQFQNILENFERTFKTFSNKIIFFLFKKILEVSKKYSIATLYPKMHGQYEAMINQ